MSDWLSPQEREEFRAYNEKRYKDQHGACLERINQLSAKLDAIKRTREQERDYADVCYENERLRKAVFRYACHCGKQGEDPTIHATWCPYRIACSPTPQTAPISHPDK